MDILRFHMIRTKPMAWARLDSHSPYNIKQWFFDYLQWSKLRKIKKTKKAWNMDETNARIGCPYSEIVVVPKD